MEDTAPPCGFPEVTKGGTTCPNPGWESDQRCGIHSGRPWPTTAAPASAAPVVFHDALPPSGFFDDAAEDSAGADPAPDSAPNSAPDGAPKPLTEQTPAEIDTRLAELETKRSRLASQIRHSRALDERYGGGSAAIRESLAEAEAEMVRVLAEIAPLAEEYRRRGGWRRYFLVANANGHVHRGMDCSTCFSDTLYNWLIDLADCDETAMVAEWGEKACTVCFPDAPTMKGFGDGTSAYAKRTAEEIAQRRAEAAERQAAKSAKQLVEPVRFKRFGWSERIETVAAAKSELRRIVEDRVAAHVYRDDATDRLLAEGAEARELLRAALAVKGMTEAELDEIEERAEKKSRREHGLPPLPKS